VSAPYRAHALDSLIIAQFVGKPLRTFPIALYARAMMTKAARAVSLVSTGIVLALLAVAGGAPLAAAQPLSPAPADGGRLKVQTLNFDLWCQETEKLAPERCDKRLPEDDAAFEAYRAKVEKYEVPYLKNKQREQSLNRTLMHSEPTINPVNNPQQPPAPNP